MTNNKEGPFRHIPGGESLPACWPECPACAYAAGVKAERERAAKVLENHNCAGHRCAIPEFAKAIRRGQDPGNER